MPDFVSRLERFESVDSTQAVVRGWLEAGADEVCVAVADVQRDGRGRLDRIWQDRPGSSLLVSVGFRPRDIAATHAWRLPAIASMAMLGAATSLLGPTADRLALKWPNDIVAVHHERLRKVAGVLTESSLEGDRVSTSIVGLGVNVDWAKGDYPDELARSMWSLSEASGRRRIDRDALLAAWLERLGRSTRTCRPATSTACAGPTTRSLPARASRSTPARAASGARPWGWTVRAARCWSAPARASP